VAAAFTTLSAYKTVQVLSPTVVQDVEYVTAQSIPNGLGFAYAVDYESWQSGEGMGGLILLAQALEAIFEQGQISGSEPLQDIDANGLLSDFVSITVSYDQSAVGLPALTEVVDVPISAFIAQNPGIGGVVIPGVELPNDYVTAAYARLQTLAAG
jgi:hypothetical protein